MKRNRASVFVSSSEEESETEEESSSESNSTECDWSEEEEEKDESESSDDEEEDDDNECLSNRVIRLLNEGKDLNGLNLRECKAYLRKYGLRISGTKAVCINRIKEHWRMKDGNVEAIYPRSSFNINCTGDVCQGDVVLFTQKVYAKYDKVTRRGRMLGKRTIAGRVVKESYGEAKQQHTFTVEVLWSKGIKQLPLLFPLLVKGRNLYKLKTYRQQWTNEAERTEVLEEKHKRGATARFMRSMKRNKAYVNGGGKQQKHLPPRKSLPSHTRPLTKPDSGKPVRHLKATKGLAKVDNNHQPSQRPVNFTNNTMSRSLKSAKRHKTIPHEFNDKASPFEITSHSQKPFHLATDLPHQIHSQLQPANAPVHFSSFSRDFSPGITRLPLVRPSAYYTAAVPALQHPDFGHDTNVPNGYLHSSHGTEWRNVNHFPWVGNCESPCPGSLHPYTLGAHTQRHSNIRPWPTFL